HGKDQSRWSALLQHLDDAQPELQALEKEFSVKVQYRAFGSTVVEFDPANPLAATDSRTDIGGALHQLGLDFARSKPLAAFLLSDGADTGGEFSALKKAGEWNDRSVPVNVFAYGNPNTPTNIRFVAVTHAVAEPSPVPSKGDLTVHATLDAPG